MWQDKLGGTNVYTPSPHVSFLSSFSCSQRMTGLWASSPQGKLAEGELKLIMRPSAIGAAEKERGCLKAPGEEGARETQKGPHFVVSETRGDMHEGEGAKQTSGEGCEMP